MNIHNDQIEQAYEHLLNIIVPHVQPCLTENEKYNDLINKIGDARFVLLGEATHGTKEFYQSRIDISKRLIAEKGFMAIAIEGDWPDTYFIHRYIQGVGEKDDNIKALSSFTRFPKWMWRNETLPPFLQWLRIYNDELPLEKKISFFGLDLYSLYSSIQQIITYLSKVDPYAAEKAKERYGCFDNTIADPQNYGFLTKMGLKKPCINEVMEQLFDLQDNAFKYLQHDGLIAQDEFFFTEQNAKVVKNAEKYYRSMFEGHVASWNNRDTHMMETLQDIIVHLEKRFNKPAKIIIWAHNSHVGNAKATEMGQHGEINIGQLIRETYPKETYSIGFSTYGGTVRAASAWGKPGECKQINPAIEGSYEDLFHDIIYDNFILTLRNEKELEYYLHPSRLQRAIGVIYLPNTERQSHYFFTQLPNQFDSIIHFDITQAVQELP